MAAKDEMSASDARANISEVIARVRLLRMVVLLTNRGRPVAGVVPVELARLARRAGGPDKAAAILAEHLDVDPAEYAEPDE